MGSLEDLPPDQRAVLQMVLQRGRSYDEIAALLSIERAAVRQRALDACELLTPDTVLPGPEHALVTDYLLGQLPGQVAEQVYTYLDAAAADREWALAISSSLASLTARDLPDIPAGKPLLADGPEAPHEQATPAREPAAHATPEQVESWLEPSQAPRERPATPPSSRRGGIVLLAVLAAAIIAVVVIVLTSGGSSKPRATASTKTAPSHTTTVATTTTGSGTTTTGTTAQPDLLAALNLTSPNGATKTLGIADVVRENGKLGIVIDAQDVPANGAHNAYALWLYNSATSYEFVGFVSNLVGKDGKLEVGGKLPKDAAAYHRLLITLETQDKPKAPGEVVLSGPFREHS